jgi:predicted Zn-dependent peptidase
MFQKTTLKNGLRVLTSSMPNALSVGIWVFVKVGSRYEEAQNAGISHFLEHMILKGSRKWPSQKELSFVIESNGGIFNGWTSRENTCYFIKLPKEKISKGVEIILDMVFHSELKEKEFEKEKGVIFQEINRRDDNPDHFIWDSVYKTMWPNHPLGQYIAGDKETVKNLRMGDLKNFFDKFYVPQNMLIAAGGDIKHRDFVEDVVKFFDKKFAGRKENLDFLPLKEKQKKPKVNLDYRKTGQSHLILAVKGIHNNHPDKFVLNVINSLLGVGWSSRLMLNIRTKKSLVYSIYSVVDYLDDIGSLCISAGVGNERVILAIKEMINELKRLKKESVKREELQQAKEKLRARILFNIELPQNQAEWYARQELFQPKVFMIKEILAKIDSVTSQDIKRVANDLFKSEKLNLVVVGPHKNEKKFQELLKKMD